MCSSDLTISKDHGLLVEGQTHKSNQNNDSNDLEREYHNRDVISTPKRQATKEELGKKIYLELGSPLSSPRLHTIETNDLEDTLNQLSICRTNSPIADISKVCVLDDTHCGYKNVNSNIQLTGEKTLNTQSSEEIDNDNGSSNDEFDEDEFQDDEFDEDEFTD